MKPKTKPRIRVGIKAITIHAKCRDYDSMFDVVDYAAGDYGSRTYAAVQMILASPLYTKYKIQYEQQKK